MPCISILHRADELQLVCKACQSVTGTRRRWSARSWSLSAGLRLIILCKDSANLINVEGSLIGCSKQATCDTAYSKYCRQSTVCTLNSIPNVPCTQRLLCMVVPCAKQGPHGAVLAQEDSSPWFKKMHSCSLLHGLACYFKMVKEFQPYKIFI